MNQSKSTHEAKATSAANTTYETNTVKYPALDPTHALMHIPTPFPRTGSNWRRARTCEQMGSALHRRTR